MAREAVPGLMFWSVRVIGLLRNNSRLRFPVRVAVRPVRLPWSPVTVAVNRLVFAVEGVSRRNSGRVAPGGSAASWVMVATAVQGAVVEKPNGALVLPAPWRRTSVVSPTSGRRSRAASRRRVALPVESTWTDPDRVEPERGAMEPKPVRLRAPV
jgi:hypothetical protein